MVEQEARVITIEGDQLVLEAETRSSCNACEVKSGCGTSVLAKWVGRKFTRFQVKNTVDARVGDQVVVGLPESALVSGSLTIYLLPLLGLIGAVVLADILLAADMASRDPVIALSGLAGFALSLLGCRNYLSKEQIRCNLTPVILRKIIQHGKLAP